ncbi:MAG: hypothetical protein L0H84_20515 [Pseudonocardia sp.]|nr:hypothetical protein [Pseudonocardia sp.]
MRRIIVAAGVVALGMVGLVGTAVAADTNAVITHSTTSYSSPSQVSAPVHHLEQGTPVLAQCFTEGQQVRGTSTWFRITQNDERGYVHRDVISGDFAGLRHC